MNAEKMFEIIKEVSSIEKETKLPDMPDYFNHIELPKDEFSYDNSQLKKQADDIANRLLPVIEEANRDSRFSKITAIISIIIAVISVSIAGVSLALQFGLLNK